MGQRNVKRYRELQRLATNSTNVQSASANKMCVLELHLHSDKDDKERGLPLSKFLKGKAKQHCDRKCKGPDLPKSLNSLFILTSSYFTVSELINKPLLHRLCEVAIVPHAGHAGRDRTAVTLEINFPKVSKPRRPIHAF